MQELSKKKFRPTESWPQFKTSKEKSFHFYPKWLQAKCCYAISYEHTQYTYTFSKFFDYEKTFPPGLIFNYTHLLIIHPSHWIKKKETLIHVYILTTPGSIPMKSHSCIFISLEAQRARTSNPMNALDTSPEEGLNSPSVSSSTIYISTHRARDQ